MKQEYPSLRKLMGDAWVEHELLSGGGRHPLGVWLRTHPKNEVVSYVERLSEFLYAHPKIIFDAKSLPNKLKAEFASTLTEIDWAVFLAGKGFAVVMEPFAPKRGPDLQADRSGDSYFLEIRTVGLSARDRKFHEATGDVFWRLKKIPSSYYVSIALESGYSAYSKQLKAAVAAVARALTKLKKTRPKEATLYYFSSKETILNIGGDIEDDSVDFRNPDELRRYVRSQKAGFKARFIDQGEERAGTIVGAHGMSLRWDDSHKRLRRILGRKRTQLPKSSRGIIVIDRSDSIIDEEDVLSALYGELRVHIPVGPDGPVGEMTTDRASTGFFGKSSRVSAVVIYKREVSPEGPVKVGRSVFPTNRADSGTIQLTLAELCCFGNVPEDVQGLTAESLPSSQ